MYVDMLSEAVGAWRGAVSHQGLVDHALECRVRMLATGTAHGATAYQALAAELAYDRALILLCGDAGIETSPRSFDQPRTERNRVERALAKWASIDLIALSCERHEYAGTPSNSPVDTCRRV